MENFIIAIIVSIVLVKIVIPFVKGFKKGFKETTKKNSKEFEQLKKKLKEKLGITLYCDITHDGLYIVGIREIENLEAIGNTEIEAVFKLLKIVAEAKIEFVE
jgi:uncharacterized membrane protein